MLFQTSTFALFFIVVFAVYWGWGKGIRMRQNGWLLLVSYFFYGCWDWRFLGLLAFSTLLDYFSAIRIEQATSDRRRFQWLWISIVINLGLLGAFKYFDFFSTSFSQLMAKMGFESHPLLLHWILPIGISFYTFHGLSYVVDVYYKRIQADRNLIDYSLFVSFFPLLVAGPIERATHLLPQLKKPRIFNRVAATDGMRQLLWGLFKKVVVADNCALIANAVFESPGEWGGAGLWLGVFCFTIQIYGDFSGYSDMAIGLARLLGIDLIRNFRFPYFSRSIAEFWRRWHVSLSSWFRDYLYIPLGGNKVGMAAQVRNTWIIFLISGLWHGANWTFICWGALNALYFMPILLAGKNRMFLDDVHGRWLPSVNDALRIAFTFVQVMLAWVLFRSESLTEAMQVYSGMFNPSDWLKGDFSLLLGVPKTLLMVCLMLLAEWFGRRGTHALQLLDGIRFAPMRWSVYYLILLALVWFDGVQQQFIYFQF
ncbi:MAG: MBOAT family O-acyltransferase [Flavobacteriales bacterium]|jgi:alginate O-acetyltransferase complex protein AlgI